MTCYLDNIPKHTYIGVDIPGCYKATGEFRCPNKGEFYISGAIPEVYQAPNDITHNYWIAKNIQTELDLKTTYSGKHVTRQKKVRTKKGKELRMFMAVRLRDSNPREEYLDSTSCGPSADWSRNLAEKSNALAPRWAKDNPIARIAEVRVEEVRE